MRRQVSLVGGRSLGLGGTVGQGAGDGKVVREDFINVQQSLHAVLTGGHAIDVLSLGRTTEVRSGLDGVRAEMHHLLDRVHDRSHQVFPAVMSRNLNDDDAGPLAILADGELELRPQVQHRDDRAAKIEDALDMQRHPWDRGDGAETDDLPHVQHRQAVRLVPELKREVAVRLGLLFGGCWICIGGHDGDLEI